MNSLNLYVYAFATFGHPNDFRQSPIVCSNPDVARNIKVFDLSNAIKVFPESTIYSIKRETVGNSILISYSIYTYAQEQASKRDGTFIGSSIILENYLTNDFDIVKALNGFHKNLTEENLNNGVLKVNHSDNFESTLEINYFDKINNPQRELPDLNFGLPNKNLVVYCITSENELEKYFNKSIDLLSEYETIYFTNNENVAKYVAQRGLFKVLSNDNETKDFDKLIKDFNLEKTEKREQQLHDFEKNIKNLKAEREEEKQNSNQVSIQNEKVNSDNLKKIKEFKENSNKIDGYYETLLDKSNQILDEVKRNNLSIETALKKFNSNKAQVKNQINEIKRINPNPNISKIKGPESNQTQNLRNENYLNRETLEYNETHSRGEKSNPYKLISLLLGIGLLSALGYFIFSNSPKYSYNDEINEEQNSITEQSKNDESVDDNQNKSNENSETLNFDILNPQPNEKLNEKDIKLVAKKIKYGLSIEDVVDIIFEKNKNDIKKHYSDQKPIYAKELYDKNKSCFKEENGVKRFNSDTLKHIPIFKSSE